MLCARPTAKCFARSAALILPTTPHHGGCELHCSMPLNGKVCRAGPDPGGFTLIPIPIRPHKGFLSNTEKTCKLRAKSGVAAPSVRALHPDLPLLSSSCQCLSFMCLFPSTFVTPTKPCASRAGRHSFLAVWPPLIQILQALPWDQFSKTTLAPTHGLRAGWLGTGRVAGGPALCEGQPVALWDGNGTLDAKSHAWGQCP